MTNISYGNSLKFKCQQVDVTIYLDTFSVQFSHFDFSPFAFEQLANYICLHTHAREYTLTHTVFPLSFHQIAFFLWPVCFIDFETRKY